MVEFQQSPSATEDAWGMIEGGKTRTLTFSQFSIPGDSNSPSIPLPVGTWYEGVVSEEPVRRQATDYETRLPATYRSGDPIYDIILRLDTQYRDPEDDTDDGVRTLFLRSTMLRALQDEMKRLNIKRFGIGTHLKIELTGFKSNGANKQPSKLYNITLQPTEYVPQAQQDVDAVLAGAGYQEATTPSFPGQVVPIQQPTPQQQPVQQAPASPPVQLVQPGQVPVAAVPAAEITVAMVGEVDLLMKAGNISRDVAIQAVAEKHAPQNEQFRAALDANIPI